MSMDDPAASVAMQDADMSEAAADDQDLALGMCFCLFVCPRFVYVWIYGLWNMHIQSQYPSGL